MLNMSNSGDGIRNYGSAQMISQFIVKRNSKTVWNLIPELAKILLQNHLSN